MEKSFLLILLQIVTESFPISSGGHIFILEKILSLDLGKSLFEIFDHLSHGSAIVCILLVFWKDWSISIVRLIRTRPYVFYRIITYVCVAEVCSAFFYVIIRVWLSDIWWLRCDISVLFGMIITMLSLFSLRWLPHGAGTYESLNVKKALLIGSVQGIALLPGISRFAATYVVGCWLGLSPRRSIQFSFLIFLPIISAAFLNAVRKIHRFPQISLFYSFKTWFFVIIATIIAYFALRLARDWALEGKFWRFGIYMIVPCVILLWIALH